MKVLKQNLLLASLVSFFLLAMPTASIASDDDLDSWVGDSMDTAGDTDEGFCRQMCPPGNGACTYEDCMGIAKKSGPAPGAPAPAPQQAAPPAPVCTTGAQSSCCLLDKSCKPGCPITRDLCRR